jgi:hypothetical protein
MSNVDKSRRGVLRLIGMAPIAAQTAAKEAAASMGLISRGSATAVGFDTMASADRGRPTIDKGWAAARLREILGGEERERVAREMGPISILDPDLASHRSLSPSVAYAIQRERNIDRNIAQQKRWLEREIKEATGGLL